MKADGTTVAPVSSVFSVPVSSLTAVTLPTGKVTVNIQSYDNTVLSGFEADIAAAPEDLTNLPNPFDTTGNPLNCVQYNYGGYTALHALIEALTQNGNTPIRFTCFRGNLIPLVDIDARQHGVAKGWICRVNGVISDPSTTVLDTGDTVEFYYNAATANQQYVKFHEASVEAARNRSATFTLKGMAAVADGTPGPFSGAKIYIDGTEWTNVTESGGVYTLTGLQNLSIGTHIITAKKPSANGVNTLTHAQALLKIKQSESSSGSGSSSMTKNEAIDALYAYFDDAVIYAYGKDAYEDILSTRDDSISNIQSASSGYQALYDTGVSSIKAKIKEYDVNTKLKALLPNGDGTVKISFEDFGIRKTGERGIDYPQQLGQLIPVTNVPYRNGENIADVTLRLLEALGIDANYSYDNEYNSFYLSSIKKFYTPSGEYVPEFGEFMSGSDSGWMITLDGWFIDKGASEFTVSKNNVIKWQNTCQLGKDIGHDFDSSNLINIVIQDNPGTLSPAFHKFVLEYTYSIPKSVTQLKLTGRPESTHSTVTYTANGITYQANDPIPVVDGTKITIRCETNGVITDYVMTVKYKSDNGTSSESTEKPESTAVIVKAPSIKVTAETTKDNTAIATVPDKSIINAVKEAETAISNAKKKGSKDVTGDITIAVSSQKEAKSVVAEVSKKSIDALAKNDALQLTIETETGSITLDAKTIANLSAQSNAKDTIQIGVSSADYSTLSKEQQDVIGTHPAFRATIQIGSKQSTSLQGTATIFLPFDLKGTSASAYAVYHMDASGKITAVTSCSYDASRKGYVIKTALLGTFFIAPVDTKSWENPFQDITKEDWFYSSIAYVCTNGLMNGTAEHTFEPNTAMSRSMLVTVLYRYAKSPKVADANPFTDVASNTWYTDAIIWANANHIVDGLGDGRFGTEENITREQVVTILYRYCQMQNKEVSDGKALSGYTDYEKISDWAKAPMEWAVASGLIQGRTETTLAPDATITRAEVSILLQRFIEDLVK